MSWRDGRTRSICKKIMLTPEEWAEVDDLYQKTKDARHYKSFSSFALDLLLTGTIVTVNIKADPVQLHGELSKIGSNINQIAHVANAAKSVSDEQIQQILDMQEELYQIVREYSDTVSRTQRKAK